MPITPTRRLPPEPMFEPTEREERLSAMAEKAKEIKPQAYDITSKNPKAPRVVHDWFSKQVVIRPGETKTAIMLRPDIAEYLGKGDLTVTPAGAPSGGAPAAAKE